jgi:hypothetical protein
VGCWIFDFGSAIGFAGVPMAGYWNEDFVPKGGFGASFGY